MSINLSRLSFNSDAFPLRVIDVSATLHSHGGVIFAEASDWSFHVISHTWSQDIRELSRRIGQTLSTQEAQSAGWKYSDCFATSQFTGEAPYEKFIDFLHLLRADGVEKIWFDALCINQTDDGEKAAEIANMGAYYALSAGCYVAVHGIGTDLGFRAVEQEYKIPRWFTRVWTYQESVLPKKLMFIVEMFDAYTRSRFRPKHFYLHTRQWVDWDMEVRQGVDHSGTYFRRRIACKEGSMSKRILYVLGRGAYMEMIGTLHAHVWDVDRTLQLVLLHQVFEKFLNLNYYLEAKYDSIDLEVVVRQIQGRECTVEEDRVLGMVGLLLSKGEFQVRTEKTLEQRLLWLADMMMVECPELLVNLCAADVEGYHKMPCASWLPDLRHKMTLNVYYTSAFVVVRSRDATVEEVKEDGKLVMTARSIQGSLIHLPVSDQSVQEDLGKDHKTPPLVRLRVDNVDDMRYHIDRDYRKEGGGVVMFKATTQNWLGPSFCIPAPSIHKLLEYKHPCPYIICQLTLLLLGHGRGNHGVIMLCVRDADSGELHKVSVTSAEQLQPGFGEKCMELFTAGPQKHFIGGFGNDLTRCLTKECQEILQKCGH